MFPEIKENSQVSNNKFIFAAKTETPTSGSSVFGALSFFGQKTTTPAAPAFGGGFFNTTQAQPAPTTTSAASIFSFSLPTSTPTSDDSPKALPFGSSTLNNTSIKHNDSPSLFGSNTLATSLSEEKSKSANDFSFASHAAKATDNESPDMFKNDPGLSFAALAQSTPPSVDKSSLFTSNPNTSGGFIGLTTRDDFSNLQVPKPGLNGSSTAAGDGDHVAEDATYDPHYDPIIALPDEITVSTGEEEEQKLFGDRAKLFRYDAVNKEWKERGVGEIKLLHHAVNNSYRLLLRREQVYKCVLNQALSTDFQMNAMKQSDKAFCWVGNNFAEDTQGGSVESLSIRFKNGKIAQGFESAVRNAVEQLKSRAELEPEED